MFIFVLLIVVNVRPVVGSDVIKWNCDPLMVPEIYRLSVDALSFVNLNSSEGSTGASFDKSTAILKSVVSPLCIRIEEKVPTGKFQKA